MIKLKPKQLEERKEKKEEVSSTKTAQQRMNIDIQNYKNNQIENAKIKFPNQNSVSQINIQIQPVEKSYYRNSKIIFSYKINASYPYEAPQVKCKLRIFHPNIDKNGNVCLSILREGWKATYDLYTVIVGLLHLLQGIRAADIEKPLDADAATLMNKDQAEFDKVVQLAIRGKSYGNREFDNIYVQPTNKK